MSYSLKRASILNISSYIYLFLASLATTPTLIKYLGIPAFSSYALALGILTLTTSIDLGLSRSVVYYLAISKNQNDQSDILSSSLLLHTALGFIFAIAASYWFSMFLGVLIFLTFIVSHYQSYHESVGNFGIVNLRSFIVGTTNTIVAAYLSSLGYGVDLILFSLSLATLITIFIMSINIPRYSILGSSITSLKKILAYGLKLQLGKLVNTFQSQYPKFIFATNPLALTVYSLSSSLVAKAAGAVSQVAIAFFPYTITNAASRKQSRYYSFSQFMLLALSVTGVISYSYFGKTLLSWWLGDESVVSSLHTFLLTYRYYGLLLVLTPLASTILDSRNMSGRSSLYALFALIIELGVVTLTYASYGVMSVAYGSLAGLLVMVPILLYTTQKTGSPGDN